MNTHFRFRARCAMEQGKLVGQKAPLRISEVWAIRVRLEIYGRRRDLALFNLAIDSTRKSLLEWIDAAGLRHNDFLFPSRIGKSPHISTRQYARIAYQWFDEIRLKWLNKLMPDIATWTRTGGWSRAPTKFAQKIE
ncbi:hypothetical protein [Duganella levis]|uniref:hypothetical protein n=1 Tax=Duganella levis TaxID=2692169 RepID=UPI001927568B|nr:hypothetical protein [Duganella levis]